MRKSYVLIDYENVQPTEFELLPGGSFDILVFLGANQSRIPVELAAALQPFGGAAKYVRLESSGSNALDFHIAYYLGVLAAENPSASFFIVSKDAGFDPLIQHVKSKGMLVQRTVRIAEIQQDRLASDPTDDERISAAVAHLVRLKAAKPRAEKTLRGTLHTLFKKELTPDQMSALIQRLRERGHVKVEGNKVSYDLPSVPSV